MSASRYNLQPSQPEPEKTPSKKIDVSEILRKNHEKLSENEKPLNLSKPKSRRKRDYFIVLILVNSALVGLFIALPSNVVTTLFTFSGVIIFSTAFTWVMWKVISDY